MATLSVIGTVVLIIIGVLTIVLLVYAIRILLLIYSFFDLKRRKDLATVEEEKPGKLSRFLRNAGVVEIIFFLLRNRGRFRR